MRKVEDYNCNKAGVYRTRTFDMDNPVDMVRYVARHPYAWPGGYEHTIITSDGGLICSDCVRENYQEMLDSSKQEMADGWQAQAITYMAAMGGFERCDHCNKLFDGYHGEEEV